MLFSSLTFLFAFLPVVLAVYYVLPSKVKNFWLLAASLFFYFYGEPKYLVIMLSVITVSYIFGLLTDKAKGKMRLILLWASVLLNLSALVYFKYTDFFISVTNSVFNTEIGLLGIALPIGISFFTFQSISYNIDVYRKDAPVQKNPLNLALYVSLFPQLVAGPIVRYTDVERELRTRTHSLDGFAYGIRRFAVGLGKKVLLANSFGSFCEIFRESDEKSTLFFWIYAVAYSLQVYFDFSGYSDMAIGLGSMFGFKFPENFRHPYISKSVTEFWRRWHISLGSFFRDYVYIPLGGNRVGKARMILNTMIVWMLTGIWHGASWNFLVWGFYYGVLLILEKFIFKKIKAKIPLIVNILFTMFLVVIGWVFFYYTDLTDGLKHLGIMFGLVETKLTDAYAIYYFKHYLGFLIAALLACFPWKVFIESIFEKHKDTVNRIEMLLKPVIVTALFVVSISMLVGQSYNPFLYFRF